MSSEARAVVGRERELDSLERFLNAVPEGPVGLRIEGEVGIGKTTLWKHAVSAARERSYRVLVSRPVESETQLAFAALGDRPGGRRCGVAVGAPRTAAAGARGRVAAQGGRRPGAARREPSRWASSASFARWPRPAPSWWPSTTSSGSIRPSASALEFVARRLREEPIGLLVAQRREPGDAPALDLERALPDDRFERLSVGPLDVEALDRLLRAGLDAQFNRACARAAARRLGRQSLLRPRDREKRAPARGTADPGPAAPGSRQPAPTRRRASGGRSLRRPATSRWSSRCSHGRRSSSLRPPRAGAAASPTSRRPSTRACSSSMAIASRFAHPLLASVLYANATAAERRRLHARLATVLDDPEERAGHLALAAEGPDAAVAAELDEAAQRARARGAPDAAATLWEQARRFTPGALAAEACRRGIEAAECHFEAGETERARTLLERDRRRIAAWTRSRPRAHPARLGSHLQGRLPRCTELFEAALAEVGDDLRLRIETERGLAWCAA